MDNTGFTEELFGIVVVPDGQSSTTHVSSAVVSPELSLSVNDATLRATIGLSVVSGRPRQLPNVQYCATSNLATSGEGLSGGSGSPVGTRYLVPYQTTASECGIYYYDGTILRRSADVVNGLGHTVFVESGEPFGGKLFVLRAANTWRAISGPDYYAHVYLLYGGAGGWQTLLSLPMVADVGTVNDVSVRFCRYRGNDLVVLEERSASYRRNVSAWEAIGSPIAFGAPGDTAILAHARASIADNAVLVEVYYEPAGGDAWYYTIEANVRQRQVNG